jgi:GNAT superfamily N-acetyltransferase
VQPRLLLRISTCVPHMPCARDQKGGGAAFATRIYRNFASQWNADLAEGQSALYMRTGPVGASQPAYFEICTEPFTAAFATPTVDETICVCACSSMEHRHQSLAHPWTPWTCASTCPSHTSCSLCYHANSARHAEACASQTRKEQEEQRVVFAERLATATALSTPLADAGRIVVSHDASQLHLQPTPATGEVKVVQGVGSTLFVTTTLAAFEGTARIVQAGPTRASARAPIAQLMRPAKGLLCVRATRVALLCLQYVCEGEALLEIVEKGKEAPCFRIKLTMVPREPLHPLGAYAQRIFRDARAAGLTLPRYAQLLIADDPDGERRRALVADIMNSRHTAKDKLLYCEPGTLTAPRLCFQCGTNSPAGCLLGRCGRHCPLLCTGCPVHSAKGAQPAGETPTDAIAAGAAGQGATTGQKRQKTVQPPRPAQPPPPPPPAAPPPAAPAPTADAPAAPDAPRSSTRFALVDSPTEQPSTHRLFAAPSPRPHPPQLGKYGTICRSRVPNLGSNHISDLIHKQTGCFSLLATEDDNDARVVGGITLQLVAAQQPCGEVLIADVVMLVVMSSFARKRIGTRLVEAATQLLQREGARRNSAELVLYTQSDDQDAALRFWANRGLEQTDAARQLAIDLHAWQPSRHILYSSALPMMATVVANDVADAHEMAVDEMAGDEMAGDEMVADESTTDETEDGEALQCEPVDEESEGWGGTADEAAELLVWCDACKNGGQLVPRSKVMTKRSLTMCKPEYAVECMQRATISLRGRGRR